MTQGNRIWVSVIAGSVGFALSVGGIWLRRQSSAEDRRAQVRSQMPGLAATEVDRVTAAFEELSAETMANPRYHDYMMSRVRGARNQQEAEALAASIGNELVGRGMPRLGLADLTEWNRIRQVFAQDPVVCAGLWTGQLPPTAIPNRLGQIPDADLRSWVRLIGAAQLAEISSTEPVNAPGLDTLIEPMLNALPEAREHLEQVLSSTSPTPDDACFASQQFMQYAARLPDAERLVFLRVLALASAN